MGFSALRVINEDFVAPSAGFPTHSHRDMEILTYILSGTIAHKDSMGNEERIKAGEFQIMSAGSGITHSEYNALNSEPLHFYQIWILPHSRNITPRYEQKSFQNSSETLILSPNAEGDSLKVYQDMKLWRYKDFEVKDTALKAARSYYLQVVSGEVKFSMGDKSNKIDSRNVDLLDSKFVDSKESVLQSSDGLMIVKESSLRLQSNGNAEILLFDLP